MSIGACRSNINTLHRTSDRVDYGEEGVLFFFFCYDFFNHKELLLLHKSGFPMFFHLSGKYLQASILMINPPTAYLL